MIRFFLSLLPYLFISHSNIAFQAFSFYKFFSFENATI